MVDLLVDSLSGEAKEFYEKEFGFFNEVTSISGSCALRKKGEVVVLIVTLHLRFFFGVSGDFASIISLR